MALKLPAIPEIEEPSELINLVANSPLWKERMAALVGIYGEIKRELDTYIKVRSLDDRESDARAAIANAESTLAEAQKADSAARELLANARRAADELKTKTANETLVITSSLSNREAQLTAAEADLSRREQALAKQQADFEVVLAEFNDDKKKVHRLRQETSAMETDLLEKVAKLRALV